MLTVKIEEHKHPRKAPEFAVWVVDGEKHLFCAHGAPGSDPEQAAIVAAAFEAYLRQNGAEAEARLRSYARENG